MAIEHSSLGINSEILRYLEIARHDLGLEQSQMKVLDLGCKDGRAVVDLCNAGYDACGIDVNTDAIHRGRDILARTGIDPRRLVTWEDPSEQSPLESSSFDFAFSYQVFEHVRDADRAAAELARITRPRGRGLHIFPGPLRPIEGHLYMPLVHWFPKNAWRRMAIRSCVALGLEPEWHQLSREPNSVKAGTYFSYSCEKTFYRTFQTWRKLFMKYGLIASDVSIEHPSVAQRSVLRFVASNGVARGALAAIIGTFKTIECHTIKPDR